MQPSDLLHGRLVPGRTPAWLRRAPAFVVVGGAWTLLYLGLYAALRQVMDAQLANGISLVLTTIGGTDGHRRLTFQVEDRTARTQAGHQTAGLVLLGIGLVITSGALWLFHLAVPDASTTADLVVLVLANGLAGLVKYVAFSSIMRPGATSSSTAGATRGTLCAP